MLSIDIPKDMLVRNILNDKYTLPVHKRRKKGYIKTRRGGISDYNIIRSHVPMTFNSRMSVLDIGCGDGSICREFFQDFKNIDYDGFDVKKEWIIELKKRYKKSNYKFFHSDLYNKVYNEKSDKSASEYIFPSENDRYDLVFAKSVFTHLTYEDTKNYIGQAGRVMKNKGGYMWATFFLLSEKKGDFENRNRPERLKFNNEFKEGGMSYYSTFKKNPERIIGYREEDILKLVEKNGMKVVKKIMGNWREVERTRMSNHHLQDTLVVECR